jgi:radical SAM protein with 4Fe4S-binding SPASM domain
VAAGIPVGVNVVLTRNTFDALEATLDRARSFGAREAQLLRYKPAGRAASLDYLARRLSPEQARSLGPLLRRLTTREENAGGRFRVQIDCALVPFLSADPTIDAASLTRFGVLGCEGGSALSALRIDGKIAPCSFAEPTESTAADLANGLSTDPEIARWRAWNDSPPEPCASCSLRTVCKGGCKVVARFVDGAHGSDPECPRVREYRS